MDRLAIINKIGTTLKSNCENCAVRGGATERELRAKGMYAQADRYCLKECPIGKELQALGASLDAQLKAQRPRKRLPDYEEEAV